MKYESNIKDSDDDSDDHESGTDSVGTSNESPKHDD